MFPVAAVAEQTMKLLAADDTTLAPAANANKIALVKASFTPGPNLAIADLTFADFDGSTPILGTTGAQLESVDPQTGDFLIDIKPPAGGYRWETTGVTNLPQTIYGFALTNNAGTVLLAAETFSSPINLTAINQSVDVGRPTLRQLVGSIE